VEEIIKKLASKYNISEFKTDLIVKAQFGLLKEAVESGEFKSVRLKHLGIFTVKKNRFNYYKDGKKEHS
jgi:nucleoid DNA-binding protein